MSNEKKRNYVSEKGSGNVWNPKVNPDGSPKAKATDADILEGFYIARKDGVGQYSSSVITIQDDNDVKHDVWLDTTLKGEIDKKKFGQWLCLQWLGKKLKKSSESKPKPSLRDTDYFHNWEVFVDVDQKPMEIAPYVAPEIVQKEVPAPGHNQPNGNSEKQTFSSDNGLPF